jgi:hypothetical protein
MKTKFAALLAGAAMLGGAGLADAADVATRADSQVVVLTNTQMDKVTAGHTDAIGHSARDAHISSCPFYRWRWERERDA